MCWLKNNVLAVDASRAKWKQMQQAIKQARKTSERASEQASIDHRVACIVMALLFTACTLYCLQVLMYLDGDLPEEAIQQEMRLAVSQAAVHAVPCALLHCCTFCFAAVDIAPHALLPSHKPATPCTQLPPLHLPACPPALSPLPACRARRRRRPSPPPPPFSQTCNGWLTPSSSSP